MPAEKGIIALMGSGELTATMVEVHKELLDNLAAKPAAVFLDTPAGFQLNVDQISAKAVEYFQSRVQHPMTVASFKTNSPALSFESQKALQTLKTADYVLIGPGSPSYAVRQLTPSPIPGILIDRIRSGGCLVAASAAALTVGRKTLPVYEIYKVGNDLHWLDGMNILNQFGFDLVVVPHWNNAEGGTHDTRFCYMGESRFKDLENMLPDDVAILGLDEHTACIIHLAKGYADVKGIGRVILRQRGRDLVFAKGDRIALNVLRGQADRTLFESAAEPPATTNRNDEAAPLEGSFFWNRIHALKAAFEEAINRRDPHAAAAVLLEMDRETWQAHQEKIEDDDTLSQAREVLRNLLVVLVTSLDTQFGDAETFLTPLVEELLSLRNTFRAEKNWRGADALRDTLNRMGISVEDTPDGTHWYLQLEPQKP